MEKTVGLASERLLPPYAKQRFTTWFKRRASPGAPLGHGAVSVFPTCFVEYMEPDVGRAIVEVYEHNGIVCGLPTGTKCCGAPWLHSGHVEEFTKAARRNVAALAAEVRAGRDVVVAQPTCAYVVKRDYPIYAKGVDADLVASHTYDPAEYLMRRHHDAADTFSLRDEFPGRAAGLVPDAVTYHVACHLQAQNAGLRSRDLLKVAGVKCTVVQRCSGIDGTWGYRARELRAGPQGRGAAGPGDRGGGHCGRVRRLPPGQRVDPPRDRDTAGAPAAADGARLWRGDAGSRRGSAVTGRLEPGGGDLTLDDILDLRAYERVRDDYRARVIARKRNRHVGLGPIMTLVFECLDTVRFQVQEMARVEKIISDEAIQAELDVYNRLLPGDRELSATLFIELTSDGALRDWLPRLVGIERQIGVWMDGEVVLSTPEARHAAALTRETVTPAVHYVRFGFTEAQVAAFRDAVEVAVMSFHPAYEARTTLPPAVRKELLGDLLGTTKSLPLG